MSSILDALKKAERESITDRGDGTPWPAPLPAQSTYRQSSRRWWVPVGVGVALCVSGALFWQTRRPETGLPAARPAAAPPPHDIQANASPSVAQAPQPHAPMAEQKQELPAKALNPATGPLAAAPAVQPVTESMRTATPAATPMMQPPGSPQEKTQRQTAAPQPEPVSDPQAAPLRRAVETATADSRPMKTPPPSTQTFRSDPRIDLQALVWAPEAAERFVVINNRLVKEGGLVDTIAVVRINPDDVLLAEGSDRWHEKFKIR